MKTEYARVFAASVVAKVAKANEIGSKTTWSTEDHLRAMATCLAEAEPVDNVTVAEQFYGIIDDTYNVSAFAQWLEKKFAGTGHYVRRDGKKAQTVSELDAMVDAQLAAIGKPAAQA
jgi:hypothetical protein